MPNLNNTRFLDIEIVPLKSCSEIEEYRYCSNALGKRLSQHCSQDYRIGGAVENTGFLKVLLGALHCGQSRKHWIHKRLVYISGEARIFRVDGGGDTYFRGKFTDTKLNEPTNYVKVQIEFPTFRSS